ncbi:hypothetical protein SESBI_11740 [Sesbania bispinosa]|nr:hypothetical protein SESBI_11740 [Sesbania bispinosa]
MAEGQNNKKVQGGEGRGVPSKVERRTTRYNPYNGRPGGSPPTYAELRRVVWNADDYTPLNAKRSEILKEIERLIKDGYLRRYVAREGRRPTNGGQRRNNSARNRADNEDGKRGEPPEEIRGTVTTIAEGFFGGGTANSARKRQAWIENQQKGDEQPSPHIVYFMELDPREGFRED